MFNPIFSVSLFSTARGEKDGYFCERCPEGYGVLKGLKGDVKLERAGGLDYLVGGEEQCVFLLCSHLATCTSMTTRGRQHRRQGEREMAGAGGEVCADLTGRLPVPAMSQNILLIALRRGRRFGFVKASANKRSETIKDAMAGMQLLLRGGGRTHSGERRAFLGVVGGLAERRRCPSHHNWSLRSKRKQS